MARTRITNKSLGEGVALENINALSSIDITKNVIVFGSLSSNEYLGLPTSNVSTLSSNWESTYTTVNANSASWSGGDEQVSTKVRSSSANWDNTYTTVNANSASWLDGSDDVLVSTKVRASSANWDGTYTTVRTLSTNWQSGYNTTRTLSATWNNTHNSVRTLSANWQNTYNTTRNLSSNWNYQGLDLKSLSANWQNTYNTVTNLSTNWTGTYDDVLVSTKVRASSANWDSTYTTVNANSATWASGGGSGVANKQTITNTNTFSIGDPIYYNGSDWVDSDASTLATSDVLGLVESATGSEFTIVYNGEMTWTAHGFTLGATIYNAAGGGLTETEPTTIGHVSKPVAVAIDANTLLVLQIRGVEIGQGIAAEIADYLEPQTLSSFASSLTMDVADGVTGITNLTEDISAFSITNAAAGQSGRLHIKTTDAWTFASDYNVLGGELATIATITALSGRCTMTWETEDASNFNLYISNAT